jgi:soluble lytic murein transglycosylase-like protein
MTEVILALVFSFSASYGIDHNIALAVIQHESGFNERAVGGHGEIGLMQLLPSSFPGYTRDELFKPEINIMLGIKYLAEVKQACKHKEDKTYLVCYNLGVTKGSNVKYPKLFPYYKNVYPRYLKFKQGGVCVQVRR